MPDFLFLANDLCLDFVNTEVVLDGVRTDLLEDFPDLAAWLEKADVIKGSAAGRIAREWGGTNEAHNALRDARSLRHLIRASAEEAERESRVSLALAVALTRYMQNPRQVAEVFAPKGRLQIKQEWVLEKPGDLLVPIAHFAANFFSTADYSAIRKCENPACILYFYDTSKNHTRRWCSMGLCGNRAKVAAFRARN